MQLIRKTFERCVSIANFFWIPHQFLHKCFHTLRIYPITGLNGLKCFCLLYLSAFPNGIINQILNRLLSLSIGVKRCALHQLFFVFLAILSQIPAQHHARRELFVHPSFIVTICAGFAYVGGACVVNKRLEKVNSVAIVEDTGGFSGIIVAAHEVGHL